MDFQKIVEGVFTVEHFMTAEECDEWIEFSEGEGYEEAKISMGRNQVMNKSVRNNERLIYESQDLANHLFERVHPYIPHETEYGKAIGLNERFRFYKYHVGQQFKPHIDGSFIRNIHEWSSYTFMIYLNEDLEGGQTRFPNATIEPKKGKALIFKHQLRHEGAPVLKGFKYVLRTDVMYRRKEKV